MTHAVRPRAGVRLRPAARASVAAIWAVFLLLSFSVEDLVVLVVRSMEFGFLGVLRLAVGSLLLACRFFESECGIGPGRSLECQAASYVEQLYMARTTGYE